MQALDLIGIGFGPSNIALAICLEEGRHAGPGVQSLFLEKQTGFAWHRHMMLDDAHMQISFLKDLATLRNPRSRFTFVNYLHEQGRLPDFINLKTFFPSRHEFNDYLAWSARQFDDRCLYGEEVVEIQPHLEDGRVELLRVKSRTRAGAEKTRLARNIVVGVGGTPCIPACFRELAGDPRVFHSSGYLHHIAEHGQARRIAVVGAGQSAAEIFMDLHGRPGAPRVDLIMRGRAMRPSDDSPFVNEIFNAGFTDYVYRHAPAERAALIEEFWHTNYAAPDLELVENMFKLLYEQKVRGETRHRFLRRHEVAFAAPEAEGIRIGLRDLDRGVESSALYDAVVLATGYLRDDYRRLLAPLGPHLDGFEVDRNYRLRTPAAFRPGIFLQGACEASHGLSDTLLSLTAIRAEEIAESMKAQAAREPRRLGLDAVVRT